MTVIYQVTDTHVDKNPEQVASRNFVTLMNYVRKHPADLLAITGDLPGDDGDKSIYTWMKSQIPEDQPVIVIPGNHDSSANLFEVFQSPHNSNPDFLEHIALAEIDLLFTNTESNALPEEQLARVTSADIRPGSVLFIHHPTMEVSGGFMDLTYPMTNRESVHQALDNSNIRHVFCGHFHTEAHLSSQYDLFVTPSPAFTVDPNSPEIIIGKPDIPLRRIEVNGTKLTTEMIFL